MRLSKTFVKGELKRNYWGNYKMTKRKFYLGDILSVTTGRLLSPEGMLGVQNLMAYLVEPMFDFHMADGRKKCAQELFRQHPQLKEIDASVYYPKWLDEQVAKFGEYLEIEQLK